MVHVAIEGRQLRSVPLARIGAMANADHTRPSVGGRARRTQCRQPGFDVTWLGGATAVRVTATGVPNRGHHPNGSGYLYRPPRPDHPVVGL